MLNLLLLMEEVGEDVEGKVIENEELQASPRNGDLPALVGVTSPDIISAMDGPVGVVYCRESLSRIHT